MASIVPHARGWRAHVYVRRQRDSKTFRTKREAEAWAARREDELRASSGPDVTFGAVAERWLALKLPQLDNEANRRTVEQSIRDYVLPDLETRKLSEIDRRDLVAVVRAVADKGLLETSHRIGQRIRAILDYAVDSGDMQAHPGAGLSRVLPPVRKGHHPALPAAEVGSLIRAIHAYSEPVTRAGLLLLAHTFVRTNELVGAEWAEIRGNVWVIPEARMKRRLPHVVPLSPQVQEILKGLRPMTDDCPYILASRQGGSISNNTMLFALYRMGYKGRMTGHGFRAVASSILNESGLWSRDAIERQLAHRETDEVREAYHRAEYLDERARMMAWWSSYLVERAASTAS